MSRTTRSDLVTIPNFEAPMQGEFFQDAARDLEALLGRLVGIGGRADGDLLAALHLFQFLPQEPRGLLLDVDLALEVEAVAHFHELMGVARVAVFAGEFAAAIGIDRPLEGNSLAGATIEQRLRGEGEVLDLVAQTGATLLERRAWRFRPTGRGNEGSSICSSEAGMRGTDFRFLFAI